MGVLIFSMPSFVAVSADFDEDPRNICVPLTPSTELSSIQDNNELSSTIEEMLDEAISVTNDRDWIDYEALAFVWASETKVACGKAYGYLKSSYRDQEHIDKCECFYNRMLANQY